MNRSLQRRDTGYTIGELLMVLWILLTVGLAGGTIWVAVHFIHKYW